MRKLIDVLANDYDVDMTGWYLVAAEGVSADGRTIVGYGRYNNEPFQAYSVTLPNPVPVPGAVLLGGIGLSVAGWRLRRRTV